jgi:hypothetical protein
MNPKKRIENLEAIVGSSMEHPGSGLPEAVGAMLADPAAVARQLDWDRKYLADDSPFKLELAGVADRGEAIAKAYEADPADSPDFQPWTPAGPEEGGQL